MVHHKNQNHLPKLTPLLAGAVVVVASIMAPISVARADQYDEQIKVLEQLKAENESNAEKLGEQAEVKETEIQKLQKQIASIQAQITLNEKRKADLTNKIEAAQKRLEEQKVLLSANIRSMYIEGDISPLEMLASSSNISDFVDKQEYRDRIKDSITSTLDEIEVLKKQLDEQRKEITRILDEKKALNDSLGTKESQASSVLSRLNQDKSAFEKQVNKQSAEIVKLRAEQRAANLAHGSGVIAGDPSRGGYPSVWANAPQDSLVDSWGMYNRECVSYTAWRVHQSGRNMPYWGGRGNANQWPDNTSNKSRTPRVGDVAIAYWGYYGHAMYVEAISGSRVYVSQYNYAVDGEYSEMWVNTSEIDWFLRF